MVAKHKLEMYCLIIENILQEYTLSDNDIFKLYHRYITKRYPITYNGTNVVSPDQIKVPCWLVDIIGSEASNKIEGIISKYVKVTETGCYCSSNVDDILRRFSLLLTLTSTYDWIYNVECNIDVDILSSFKMRVTLINFKKYYIHDTIDPCRDILYVLQNSNKLIHESRDIELRCCEDTFFIQIIHQIISDDDYKYKPFDELTIEDVRNLLCLLIDLTTTVNITFDDTGSEFVSSVNTLSDVIKMYPSRVFSVMQDCYCYTHPCSTYETWHLVKALQFLYIILGMHSSHSNRFKMEILLDKIRVYLPKLNLHII